MKRLSAVLLMMGWAAAPVFADKVHLKNGNAMEGLILREDRSELELDIGYGTVVLNRADIDRVERSTGKEKEALLARQKEAEFASGRKVPPGCREAFERFKALKVLREKALDARRQKERFTERATALEGEILSARQDYPALRLKLQQAPRRDPSYNKIVHELNVLSSGIEAGRAELDDVRRKAGEVQGEINAFLTAFDEFNVLMAKGPGFAGKRDLSAEESEFYGWMRRSAEAMEENFRTLSVGEAKRGSHIVVQAAINDRGRASLLVDTGATFTVLSQRAAQALGINPEGSPGSARLHLADGRAVYGQVAILDSVEVAGMTAHRVEAVILPEFEEGLDGLLGMSFLKRFDVRVDPEAGRLILRDMK